MLNIVERNHEDLVTLKHGTGVFHDALAKVKEAAGLFKNDPAEGPQTVLEMIALPERFCIVLNQGGETDVYAAAFCNVLRENGISCEIEGVLHGNTGYIAHREFEKW